MDGTKRCLFVLFLCEDGLDFVQADVEHFADLFEAHSFGVEAGDYLIPLLGPSFSHSFSPSLCATFCTTGFVAHLAVGCVLSFESSFVVHIAIIFYAFLLRKTCKSANVITIVSSSKSWLSFSRNVSAHQIRHPIHAIHSPHVVRKTSLFTDKLPFSPCLSVIRLSLRTNCTFLYVCPWLRPFYGRNHLLI